MENNHKTSRRAIIIVGAGLLQIPAIKIAKEQGLCVIATDMNPHAPGFEYADLPVELSTKDVQGHIEMALKLKAQYDICGVYTAGADVAITIANTAAALGLPAVKPEAALASNNKAIMRERFARHKVPSPQSYEVNSLASAKEAMAELGLPVIVKAIDNAAARGAQKIEDQGSLPEAFANACRYSSTNTAIVEEFLVGPEQSVETIVYKGVHYRCGIADRHFGFAPYFIEVGHTNPSALPLDVQEEIYKTVEQGAKALGIDFGPAKADVLLTNDGPKILEIAARLSGGFNCQYTTPLAYGTGVIKAAMDIAVGRDIDADDLMPKFYRYSAERAFLPGSGKLLVIEGVQEAKNIPGVAEIFLFLQPGDTIRELRNNGDKVGHVITAADSREEAVAIAELALQTVKFVTE
ncbi:MAG: ATP-grasp domain-containing protein [Eubacteriales bacterium]